MKIVDYIDPIIVYYVNLSAERIKINFTSVVSPEMKVSWIVAIVILNLEDKTRIVHSSNKQLVRN